MYAIGSTSAKSSATELRALLGGGKHASRKLKRAQILLAADCRAGERGDREERRRGRLDRVPDQARLRGGQSRTGAERRAASRGRNAKLTVKEESLAGGDGLRQPTKGPWPAGRSSCWQVAMVRLTEHKSLSHETVRRRLAENGLKPWRKDMWCIPQVDGEYVARMEDVLDLYAAAPDPKRPVVCFDESRGAAHRARPVNRFRPRPAGSNVTITSIVATARSISSFSSTCIVPWLQGQSHQAARGRRLRPMPARPRRCPLSRRRDHPGRPG